MAQETRALLREQVEQVDDGAKGQSKKRIPPLHNHEIHPGFFEGECRADPGEGIDGVYAGFVLFTQRFVAVVVLGFAREEQARILPLEGDKFHRVFLTQFSH